MNKKEVLEIRKQFTPANCAITRIAGCYVNQKDGVKKRIPVLTGRGHIQVF